MSDTDRYYIVSYAFFDNIILPVRLLDLKNLKKFIKSDEYMSDKQTYSINAVILNDDDGGCPTIDADNLKELTKDK